jgi:hypothetical protein
MLLECTTDNYSKCKDIDISLSITEETAIWVQIKWKDEPYVKTYLERTHESLKQIEYNLFFDVPPKERSGAVQTFKDMFEEITSRNDVFFLHLSEGKLRTIGMNGSKEFVSTIDKDEPTCYDAKPSMDHMEKNINFYSTCRDNKTRSIFNAVFVKSPESSDIQSTICSFAKWGTKKGTKKCIIVTDYDVDYSKDYNSKEINAIIHTGNPSLSFLSKCKTDKLIVMTKVCINGWFTIGMGDKSQDNSTVAILDTKKHVSTQLSSYNFHTYIQFPVNYANFVPLIFDCNASWYNTIIQLDLYNDDNVTKHLKDLYKGNPIYRTEQVRLLQSLVVNRQLNTPLVIRSSYQHLNDWLLINGIYACSKNENAIKYTTKVNEMFMENGVINHFDHDELQDKLSSLALT